jgi:hypothetical protein
MHLITNTGRKRRGSGARFQGPTALSQTTGVVCDGACKARVPFDCLRSAAYIKILGAETGGFGLGSPTLTISKYLDTFMRALSVGSSATALS